MQPKHVIVISEERAFVLTEEIPEMIALALHPTHLDSLPSRVTNIEKVKKHRPVESGRKFWFPEDVTFPINEQFTPLDLDFLDKVWGVPSRPILVRAWEPLRDDPLNEEEWNDWLKRFEEAASALDWTFDATVKPAEDFFHKQRLAVEMKHFKLLRDAIEKGDLDQLDPSDHTNTTQYNTRGKVPIESLSKYVKKFHIEISTKAPEIKKTDSEKWWQTEFEDLLSWANRIAERMRNEGVVNPKGMYKGMVSAEKIYQEIEYEIQAKQERRRRLNPNVDLKRGISASLIKNYLKSRGFDPNPK